MTDDVPAYAVVAGVPSTVIKYRFAEDVRQRILASRWWDQGVAWLAENGSLLTDAVRFVHWIGKEDR